MSVPRWVWASKMSRSAGRSARRRSSHVAATSRARSSASTKRNLAAAGTTWQATALSGTIPAGGRYLVQLASGGVNGAGLPTPDATGTSNLAVTGGKVALVDTATALSCGTSPGSCSAVSTVEDLIGYG